MFGMLSRAPATLPPLLTIQAFKSASSSLDSNKRLCKSWPSARNDALLEPTSVLDIRSPSPSSTLSSSLTGSCEGGLGSIESAGVDVSGLLSEAASEGHLPACTSLLDANDGSVWKVSQQNAGEAEDENGFSASVSKLQEGVAIEEDPIGSWESISYGQDAALVGAQQNIEGSSGGMTGISDMITGDGGIQLGRRSMIVHGKQGQCNSRSNELVRGGGLERTGNLLKREYSETFSLPSNPIGGVKLPSNCQNMHGLSSELKLKEAKKEVLDGRLNAGVVSSCYQQDPGAPALSKLKNVKGGVSSGIQSEYGSTGEEIGGNLEVTEGALRGGDEQGLQKPEEWLAELHEFHVGGDSEKVTWAMDDLATMLLESPSPAPDHSLMRFLLGENEDQVQHQPKEDVGGHGYGVRQLDLHEAMEVQLSNGLFGSITRSSDTPPSSASFSISLPEPCFSMVGNSSPLVLPSFSTSIPPPNGFPPAFHGVPSVATSSCFPKTNHLFPPRIDSPFSALQSSSIQSPALSVSTDPESLQSESKPVTHPASMLHPMSASSGCPAFESKILPMETTLSHSSLLSSCNFMLSDIYGNSSVLIAKDKQPGPPMLCQAPLSSPNLPRSAFFPHPPVPFNHPQPVLSQQRMLYHAQNAQLGKPVQWQQLRSEPAWQSMQKSIEDPFPDLKHELPTKSQHNQERLFALQRRHIQFPELHQLSQWVQKGKVGSEEVQLTMVDQLLKAAEAVEFCNTGMAQAILARLNQQLSPQGKPLQRAAFHFREALAKRLAGLGPPCQATISSPIDMINKISAFKNYCEVSPIPQFAHFTTNQAILEAMEGEESIHLIDFELGLGGQWASFLQEIALRPGGPPKVRITTIDSDSTEMQLTKEILHQFARDLNISLEFHAVSLEFPTASMFQIREREAVAVNFAFVFNRLMAGFPSTDSYISFLRLLKDLSPKVVTVVEIEVEDDGCSFSQHFLRSLQCYEFLFDSLEASVSAMETVLRIEKMLFAPRIAALVEGRKRNEKHPHWRSLLRGAGFCSLAFSNTAETQAEYLIGSPANKGFNIAKIEGSLLLGWQGRSLVSASVWV